MRSVAVLLSLIEDPEHSDDSITVKSRLGQRLIVISLEEIVDF